MLLEERRLDALQEPAKDERYGEGVVHVADNGDEIRNEVEREGEIAGEHEQQRLRPAGHSSVSGEAAEQDGAIGNQSREGSEILPPAH
jgi:hypothetical protein